MSFIEKVGEINVGFKCWKFFLIRYRIVYDVSCFVNELFIFYKYLFNIII